MIMKDYKADEGLQGNDKIEKAKYLVKEDDKIVIQIPAPKLLEVIPQDIPINIVYEDKDIIVVVKPAGMASQEERSMDVDMVSWLKTYLVRQNAAGSSEAQ